MENPDIDHVPFDHELLAPTITIENLPDALGFAETSELRELRAQLTEAMIADSDKVKTLASLYRSQAETIINHYQGEVFAKAQIGLTVRMGLIKFDAGRLKHYLEDLEDALVYAYNMRLDETAAILEATLQDASN